MTPANRHPKTGPKWGGFGAYIHWPYCRRICAYCDFNVYKSRDENEAHLIEAIVADFAYHKSLLPDHPKLDTIYFGGGTPSLMSARSIETLLDAARTHFGVTDACEITLEANPTDISEAACLNWRAAGINRLSVGVQSLTDASLKWLTRDHSADEAKDAIAVISDIFPNFSVDAIYALPAQTPEIWTAELEAFLALNAPHYSLYELTIKQGTAFGAQVDRGDWRPADEDLQADLYALTEDKLRQAGYTGYEVSNYCRGAELRARHNSIYWNSGDWLGLGPGAHGRLTINNERYATEAAKKPDAYINRPRPPIISQKLTTSDTKLEMLAMGLRQAEGFALGRLGEDLDDLKSEIDRINQQTPEIEQVFTHKNSKLMINPQFRLFTDLLTSKLSRHLT